MKEQIPNFPKEKSVEQESIFDKIRSLKLTVPIVLAQLFSGCNEKVTKDESIEIALENSNNKIEVVDPQLLQKFHMFFDSLHNKSPDVTVKIHEGLEINATNDTTLLVYKTEDSKNKDFENIKDGANTYEYIFTKNNSISMTWSNVQLFDMGGTFSNNSFKGKMLIDKKTGVIFNYVSQDPSSSFYIVQEDEQGSRLSPSRKIGEVRNYYGYDHGLAKRFLENELKDFK